MNAYKSSLGNVLAFAGIALQISLAIGAYKTAHALANTLHAMMTYGLDPQSAAFGFTEITEATVAYFIGGLFGMVLLCVALVSCRYRAKWFLWFLFIYSALLFAASFFGSVHFGIFFPVMVFYGVLGTIFSSFFFFYCLIHGSEFGVDPAPTTSTG